MKSPFLKVVIGIAAWGLSAALFAQAYPSRPVRMVIPFAPGTGVDVVARLVGNAISKNVGQPFVADQRLGAAGAIGAAYVVNSPGDGYTLLFNTSSHTSLPVLTPDLPYDTLRDLAGVTTLVENPLILITSKVNGYRNVADLVAAGKAKPGSLNFASGGVGTSTHISAEKFRAAAGFEAVHVPFKSTTDALTEIMAGRMDFTYTALTSAIPGIRDGRLVPLAMSYRRTPVMPELPTLAEAGVPAGAYSSWLGMIISAKTPRAIVNRLYQETVKVMATPELQADLAKIGAEPMTLPPDEFDALRRRELAANEILLKNFKTK